MPTSPESEKLARDLLAVFHRGLEYPDFLRQAATLIENARDGDREARRDSRA